MADDSPPQIPQADLARILDSVMDAVISIDLDQRILAFNPAASEMFGCDADEAIGSSLSRFIPERYRTRHAEQVRIYAETGATRRSPQNMSHVVGLRTDGEEFPIEASITRTETRGRKLLTAILRDVSEQHRQRELQRRTNQTLATLIENLPGMVYRCRNDRDWTVDFLSEGARDLTGYEPEEFTSGFVRFGDLIVPEDRERVWEEVQTAIGSNERFSVEYQIQRKDGSRRWVSERGIGVRDPSGEFHLEGFIQDVDTERRAADELRASEARIRAVTAHAPVAIFETDADGYCAYVNPKFCELIGTELEQIVGKYWVTAIPQANRIRLDQEWAEAVRLGRGEMVLPDWPFERPDGTTSWMNGWVVALRDRAGTLTGYLGTFVDSTDRRTAEETNRYLAAIVESSDDSIITRNLAGAIASWNPAAESMYGYTSHEAIGRPMSMLVPEDRKRESDEIEDRSLSGERIDHLETQRARKDGSLINVSLSVSPIRAGNGELVGTATIARDISQQRIASEARASLSAILEASLNEIFVFHADSLRFLRVNRGARENLGYSMEELSERTPVDIKPDLDEEEFQKLLAPLRRGEQERVQFETQHERKDGSRYPAEVHLQLGTYEGAPAFVALILDISERTRASEVLRLTEERAHRAEKLASISTLTAGIAHDVGAPMTAILGHAELMQKSLTDDKNRRRATIIIEQVNRISHLIQSLLNMARPGEHPTQIIELAPVLEKSLDFSREKLHAHRIQVEQNFAQVPRIIGDPDQLQQAFLNLIINAVDAMPGGGTLRVTLARPGPRHIEVRIADTGTGIDPELLPRVFEPFTTSKPRGRGTGLGLVVVKDIVEAHGGTISAESRIGEGTEFAVLFEVVDD